MSKLVWNKALVSVGRLKNARYAEISEDGLGAVWAIETDAGWMIEDEGDESDIVVAGPFPTLEAAKLAAELLYE